MPVQINPPLNDNMFTSEFCRLCLKGTPGQKIALTIYVDGTKRFSNTYTASAAGTVDLYDLDRLLEAEIEGVWKQVALAVDGVQLTPLPQRAFRCAASLAEPAQTFLENHFLTTAERRDTLPGRYETLTAYCREQTPVRVFCHYFKAPGAHSRKTVELATASGLTTLNVSPALFEDAEMGRLFAYTVSCGARTAHYRVRAHAPKADPAFIFRNSFYVWETLYLTGKKETAPAYTRSQANIAGRLRNYDIRETMTFKARTGPLREGMEQVALDVARSREVFLLNADGTAGDDVTVTDCDTAFSNDPAEIRDMTITYRLADRRNARIATVERPGIFTREFDGRFC